MSTEPLPVEDGPTEPKATPLPGFLGLTWWARKRQAGGPRSSDEPMADETLDNQPPVSLRTVTVTIPTVIVFVFSLLGASSTVMWFGIDRVQAMGDSKAEAEDLDDLEDEVTELRARTELLQTQLSAMNTTIVSEFAVLKFAMGIQQGTITIPPPPATPATPATP